jgi:hypothetical protein
MHHQYFEMKISISIYSVRFLIIIDSNLSQSQWFMILITLYYFMIYKNCI